MSFAAPLALLALAAVPLTVVALLVAQRRRVRYAVRYPALDVLARVAGQVPRWRRYLPAALFLLAVATLLVGTARPMARVPVPREEATVMLVLDVSGSMNATDVEPNRLEAARAAPRASSTSCRRASGWGS
jgi:Ca-activated chloride channel homolog